MDTNNLGWHTPQDKGKLSCMSHAHEVSREIIKVVEYLPFPYLRHSALTANLFKILVPPSFLNLLGISYDFKFLFIAFNSVPELHMDLIQWIQIYIGLQDLVISIMMFLSFSLYRTYQLTPS